MTTDSQAGDTKKAGIWPQIVGKVIQKQTGRLADDYR